MKTIILIILFNVFITFAWYGHLKYKDVSLWKVILVSWGIAFNIARKLSPIVMDMKSFRQPNSKSYKK
jgi:uncharacterized protein (DUF486 family)